VPDWPWSYIAFFTAAGAAVVALGAWIYAAVAIRRERERRHQRVQEAAWQWARSAATKEEVAELKKTVDGIDTSLRIADVSTIKQSLSSLEARTADLATLAEDASGVRDLRDAIAEMSDRMLRLEAEQRSRADEEAPARFPRFPRL
jgi:sugar-specific transcriptional regulator TrmB